MSLLPRPGRCNALLIPICCYGRAHALHPSPNHTWCCRGGWCFASTSTLLCLLCALSCLCAGLLSLQNVRERNPQKSGCFIAQEASKGSFPRVFPRRRYISHTHIFEYSSYPINLSTCLSGANKRLTTESQEKKYCVFEARTLALSSSHQTCLLSSSSPTFLFQIYSRSNTQKATVEFFFIPPLLFAASPPTHTEPLLTQKACHNNRTN